MDFQPFKHVVAASFAAIQKHQLFRVNVDKDLLWSTYQSSFPEGTNPKFRERAEHDCGCCKQFIRAVGDVVAIVDGRLVSVWDVEISEPGYQTVADAMSALVKSAPVSDLFLHFERTAGTDKTFEQMVDRVHTWSHFYVNIDPKFVRKNKDIPQALSEPRSTYEVFLRALNTITINATETVLELIAQRSLYRGDEHKFVLNAFLGLQKKFAKLSTDVARSRFAWVESVEIPKSVSKVRNTSIGQMLQDLSEGKDVEDAVRAFEAMVAPTNYQRPTALVTKSMIEKAKATLDTLGLTSALDRRYARLSDVKVTNIIFADREVRKKMNGNVFDDLIAVAGGKAPKTLDKVEEVAIDRFVTEIVPHVESIELMLENQHVSNLVSLIAPEDPTAGRLFQWSNGFSWSYNGEMADSMKERVKKAGGNVTGDLCCRLAWEYTDDLDFHMIEPNNSGHIYFGSRRSPGGGVLDVDANGGNGMMAHPVENIFYTRRLTMREGVYTLMVNNFRRRSGGEGFEVEIDYLGAVTHFSYGKTLRDNETVTVAKFKYTHAGGIEMVESLPSTQAAKSTWGVSTQSFHRVNLMLASPNYWDDQKGVGNKHYFFMLNGCVNDGTARPFFNEFLKEDLKVHRKVFEIVGSKLKVEESDDQLSGLGFSSTAKNAVFARVKGSFTRTIKIIF